MTIAKISNNLKKLKSALIFSHNRPDGDTIGSAIALKNALEGLGIKADLCCEGNIPSKYAFIDGVNLYKKSAEYVKTVSEYDAVISVDCSAEVMFSDAYSVYQKGKIKFNIDHHISNTRYADFNYVENTAANTEIIFKIVKELGVNVTKTIANALLLGMVTDTGNFAHSNVTSDTMSAVSNLISLGGDLNLVVYKAFKEQSKERAKLFAKTISNIRFELDGALAFISISRADVIASGGDDSITEGFIDFPLSVAGVEVAISLLETADKRYKISFRSKGKVNVNEIASLYGGGGHILASGAVLNGYKEDIIDKLTYNVKQRI